MPPPPATWRKALPSATVAFAVALFGLALVVRVADGQVLSALPGLVAIAFAVVGATILAQRPGNRIGWLFAAGSMPTAVLNAGTAYAHHGQGSLPGATAAAAAVNAAPLLVLGILVAVLPQLFPTGAPVSPRWRVFVAAGWGYTVIGTLSNLFAAEQVQGLGVANPAAITAIQPVIDPLQLVALICLVSAVVAGIAGLVVRWRRSRGDERQQLKWFLAGFVPVLVPIALHDAYPDAASPLIALLLTLVPVTIGVAVLRYHLYDLDVVINRVVVYTTLSTATAAVYLALVVLAETVAGWGHGLPVQVVATVVAAALFQPLRLRVQHAVDRLFYGDRARPYDALTRLGVAIEHAPAPDDTLARVVDEVAGALKVPYAAIEFTLPDGTVTATAHGALDGEPIRFPMVYQDETIGHLAVSGRAPGEAFSASDRRLLTDLARQAGVAAHASRVTTALQQARLALITAREEERRRLRRDLHDELGPTLAGVTLGLHAAQATIPVDAERATILLAGIETQVENAVSDIRRLVYGLRPPALDEYGLYRAVQQYASSQPIAVTVFAPDGGLGELPAAVEVAAYRIATEAITNVSRHAHATACEVALARSETLLVEVCDNGRGIPPDTPAGVGLTAMRERAEELGGHVTVASTSAGTKICARLPIPEGT